MGVFQCGRFEISALDSTKKYNFRSFNETKKNVKLEIFAADDVICKIFKNILKRMGFLKTNGMKIEFNISFIFSFHFK